MKLFRLGLLLGAVLLGLACAGGEIGEELDPGLGDGADSSPSGACGTCPKGTACSGTRCLCYPKMCTGCCSRDQSRCHLGTELSNCGRSGVTCVDCKALLTTCANQTCVNCKPICKDRECGGNGCGGSCGTCLSGKVCSLGKCVCPPQCDGKCTGAADGCGGTCQVSKCSGCCAGTTCNKGTDNSACGKSGSPCSNCGAASSCSTGSCVAGQCSGSFKPDGTSCSGGICHSGQCCSGCWDGSTCRTGNTVSKCGKGGGSCKSCNDGLACTIDTCQNGTCTHSNAAKGTACTSGTCNQGACCTGCWAGTECRGGISVTYCGQGGVDCKQCAPGNDCKSSACSNGACTVTVKPDGTPCTGGTCTGGSCCTGCTSGGSCLAGTGSSGCGQGGTPCKTCSPLQTCSGGACGYPTVTHDGCSSVQGKSCGGCTCEGCVCLADPPCCSTLWDSACANRCKRCNTNNGCTTNPSGLSCQGCGGCACEDCVCAMDSYCCTTNWDSICAGECKNNCGSPCP